MRVIFGKSVIRSSKLNLLSIGAFHPLLSWIQNIGPKTSFNCRILIGVSVVFFFSWAPLNIFNIVDLLVKTSEDPGTQVFPFFNIWIHILVVMVLNFEKWNFRKQCWSSSQSFTSLPWALSAPTPSCKKGCLLCLYCIIVEKPENSHEIPTNLHLLMILSFQT